MALLPDLSGVQIGTWTNRCTTLGETACGPETVTFVPRASYALHDDGGPCPYLPARPNERFANLPFSEGAHVNETDQAGSAEATRLPTVQ
jgi:hypothetical protein